MIIEPNCGGWQPRHPGERRDHNWVLDSRDWDEGVAWAIRRRLLPVDAQGWSREQVSDELVLNFREVPTIVHREDTPVECLSTPWDRANAQVATILVARGPDRRQTGPVVFQKAQCATLKVEDLGN